MNGDRTIGDLPRCGLRRMRALLVAATLLFSGALTQAAQGASAPLQLRRVTAIELRASAGAHEVALPKAVTLRGSCFPDRTLRVEGGVDAVLIALIPPGQADPIYFGRLPRRQGATPFSNLCGTDRTLAAGTYRLIVLKTGGTGRAILSLPGLTGAVSLRPAGRTSATLAQLPEVSAYTTTAGHVGSYGDTRQLRGRGFIAVIGWATHADPSVVLTLGDCEMRRSATSGPLDDAVDFAPGCPSGSSSSTIPGPSGSGTNFFASTYSNIAPDSWGAGLYYVSTSTVSSSGALGAWVPFDA